MTAFKPMLASPITEVDAQPTALATFCRNDGWVAEQKVDGHRRLVTVQDGRVTGLNRKGEPTTLPAAVRRQFEGIAGDFIFDGELLGQTLYLFDLPHAGEILSLVASYEERRDVLERLFHLWEPSKAVRMLPLARTTEAKALLASQLLEAGCEGVMLKRLDAPYQPGRRSRDWLKAKFWNDVDCVVTRLGIDGKQNMELVLFDAAGKLVRVGECTTLAADGPRVRPGDVVTIKCLYATMDNKLYGPPTMPRIRDDKTPAECTLDQLDACRVNKKVLT